MWEPSGTINRINIIGFDNSVKDEGRLVGRFKTLFPFIQFLAKSMWARSLNKLLGE